MAYRKLLGTALFTGETIVHDTVLVTDDAGRVLDLLPLHAAGDDVQVFDGLLSPGFVNCHCHLELSHMKGKLPQGSGLVAFLLGVMGGRRAGEDEMEQAMHQADAFMYSQGISLVGDICNTAASLKVKRASRIVYRNFVEATGWLPGAAGRRFAEAQQVQQQFHRAGLQASLVPHAPYSVSPELWALLKPSFRSSVVCIHNQETACEDELFTRGTGAFRKLYSQLGIDDSFFQPPGCDSLSSYLPQFAEADRVLLVHNTFTEPGQAARAESLLPGKLYWCFCPNANLYIEGRLPALPGFEGYQRVLGTDSLASNHRLSVLDEIQTLLNAVPALELETVLRWATLQGARALQAEQRFGSFEKGKQPGVICIRGFDGSKASHMTVERII